MTPEVIRWRVVDKRDRPVTHWRSVFDVHESLPHLDFAAVYADGTTQNHARSAGRYRFRLARGLTAGAFAAGTYTLQVTLVDARGNTARSSWDFGIAV